MKRAVLLVVFVCIVCIAGSTVAQTVTMYFQIEGPNGRIFSRPVMVLDFNLQGDLPINNTTGAVVGENRLAPVSVTLRVDQDTPKIFEMFSQGEGAEATLQIMGMSEKGKTTELQNIKFHKVRIASVKQFTPGDQSEKPELMVGLQFICAQIELSGPGGNAILSTSEKY
jgi:hypothetical protein